MSSMKMIILAMALTGWVSVCMAQDAVVVAGKMIKVEYTLTVNNEQIETSVGKEPLEFVFGEHTIIPGLEKGIEGMRVGEEKTLTIKPKDGYGEIDPKAFKEFPKSTLPSNVPPKVGMVLQAQDPNGQNFPTVISEIKKDTVVLDFNHPLAGKELMYKIKIIDITNAPPAGAVPVAMLDAAAKEDAPTKK
ncbi:MAG: peptidylprolyl isomerase [Candidatus Omnitrophota bacterium]